MEAVTALEISLANKIKATAKTSQLITREIQAYYNLTIKSQLSILAVGIDNLLPEEVELSYKAIDIRNNIVHEAYIPKDDEKKILYDLLNVVSKIIEEPIAKFPPKSQVKNTWTETMWAKYDKRNN